MQYGFLKPILVQVALGVTAVKKVKQEKLKSQHIKIICLSHLLHPTQFCIHPTSPAMPKSIHKLDNYKMH